jgi:hypothetical protein
MPDGLADPPADPVPHDRLAQRPRNRKADTGTVRLRFADEKRREQGTGVFDARIVDPAKILGAQQTDTFRKTSDRVTTSPSSP